MRSYFVEFLELIDENTKDKPDGNQHSSTKNYTYSFYYYLFTAQRLSRQGFIFMRTMTTEYKPLILQYCPCKFFLPAVTQKKYSYKPTRKRVLTTIYFPDVTCRFWDFVRFFGSSS